MIAEPSVHLSHSDSESPQTQQDHRPPLSARVAATAVPRLHLPSVLPRAWSGPEPPAPLHLPSMMLSSPAEAPGKTSCRWTHSEPNTWRVHLEPAMVLPRFDECHGPRQGEPRASQGTQQGAHLGLLQPRRQQHRPKRSRYQRSSSAGCGPQPIRAIPRRCLPLRSSGRARQLRRNRQRRGPHPWRRHLGSAHHSSPSDALRVHPATEPRLVPWPVRRQWPVPVPAGVPSERREEPSSQLAAASRPGNSRAPGPWL